MDDITLPPHPPRQLFKTSSTNDSSHQTQSFTAGTSRTSVKSQDPSELNLTVEEKKPEEQEEVLVGHKTNGRVERLPFFNEIGTFLTETIQRYSTLP